MVETILRLCHVALPLLTAAGAAEVELPVWGLQGGDRGDTGRPGQDPSSIIVSLIFAKIGADHISPFGQSFSS